MRDGLCKRSLTAAAAICQWSERTAVAEVQVPRKFLHARCKRGPLNGHFSLPQFFFSVHPRPRIPLPLSSARYGPLLITWPSVAPAKTRFSAAPHDGRTSDCANWTHAFLHLALSLLRAARRGHRYAKRFAVWRHSSSWARRNLPQSEPLHGSAKAAQAASRPVLIPPALTPNGNRHRSRAGKSPFAPTSRPSARAGRQGERDRDYADAGPRPGF